MLLCWTRENASRSGLFTSNFPVYPLQPGVHLPRAPRSIQIAERSSLQSSHRCAAWTLFRLLTQLAQLESVSIRNVLVGWHRCRMLLSARDEALSWGLHGAVFPSHFSAKSSASAAGSSAGPGSAAPGPRELEARQRRDSKRTHQLRTLCALRRRRRHGRKRGALVCFLNSGCPSSQSLREPWEGTITLQITKLLNNLINPSSAEYFRGGLGRRH